MKSKMNSKLINKTIQHEAMIKTIYTLMIIIPIFMILNFVGVSRVPVIVVLVKMVIGLLILSLFFYFFYRNSVVGSIENNYYQALFQNELNAAFSLDIYGYIVELNDQSEFIFGYGKQELIGKSIFQFIHKKDIQLNKKVFESVLKGDTQRFETSMVHKRGYVVEVEIISVPVLLTGKVIGVVGTSQVISERKNLQYELERLAHLDGLTEIPNRRMFDNVMTEAWGKAYQTQKPISLIMTDIDYFKIYNDTYGHLQGDTCLKKIAEILYELAKEHRGTAARFGGEEFVIILPEINTKMAKTIAYIANDRIESLALPHEKSAISSYITVSLGVATVFPSDTLDKNNLISLADQALYQSKLHGRNTVSTFEIEQLTGSS